MILNTALPCARRLIPVLITVLLFAGLGGAFVGAQEEKRLEDWELVAHAIYKADIETLTLLFEQGVPVDDPGRLDKAKTLLMVACDVGSTEAVSFLLEHGANPNLRDSDGKSSLAYLPSSKYNEEKRLMPILRLLLNAGVSIDSSGLEDSDFLVGIANSGDAEALLYVLDQEPFSTLFLEGTVMTHEKPLPELLLSRIIQPMYGSKSDICAILARLKALGADLSAGLSEGDSYLFKTRNPEVLLALLDLGLPVDATDDSGNTILNDAVDSYNKALTDPEYIRALVSLGVPIDQANSSGETALMNANTVKTASLLVELGADIHTRDSYGRTLIIKNAYNLHDQDMIQFFYQSGVAVDARDDEGMTAIHKAARFGTTENVYLLASLGASLLTRDNSGCSALDHYIDWLPRELSRWDTKFLAGKPLNFVQYLLDAGISAGTPGIEGELVQG